jgi:hypothetical protein
MPWDSFVVQLNDPSLDFVKLPSHGTLTDGEGYVQLTFYTN